MKNDTTICIVLPNELKKKAQNYASDMNISFNSLVRLCLTDYLKKNN